MNKYLDIRDRYILTQALTIAIKELKQVPAPYTELSNIENMEHLLNTVFAEFAGVVEHLEYNKNFEEKVELNG